MPELIDVPLEELEPGNEYSVIFPMRHGIHQAYLTEFIEGNSREFLFKVKDINSEPLNASINIGETFIIYAGEQTFDINNREKYMVLQEQSIIFLPDLEGYEPGTDNEISSILDNRNETERTRRLRILLMGRRLLHSPLLHIQRNSPSSRSEYRIGGKKRNKRTRRKKKGRKSSKKKQSKKRRN